MIKKRKINFRGRDLLFVDLETSGLNINKHEITEVGCLVVDGKTLEIINKYHARVKLEHIETGDKDALRIGGYSKELWKNARCAREVLVEVAELVPDGLIAGWKVDFDWNFLEKGFREHKIQHSYDYHLIDVISMAYRHFHGKMRPTTLSLRHVSRELGIEIPDEHDAMTDIRATYEVFRKLMEL